MHRKIMTVDDLLKRREQGSTIELEQKSEILEKLMPVLEKLADKEMLVTNEFNVSRLESLLVQLVECFENKPDIDLTPLTEVANRPVQVDLTPIAHALMSLRRDPEYVMEIERDERGRAKSVHVMGVNKPTTIN